MALLELTVLFFVLVISAVPLYVAVKLIGGKTTLLKVILVNIIIWIIALVLRTRFGILAGLLTFVAMLFIYSAMFKFGLFRAFIAWFLQGVVIIIFVLVLAGIGITLISL